MDSRNEREAYFAELRAKFAQLNENLQSLEQRAEHETSDTQQYLQYLEQFRQLRQRSAAMSGLGGDEVGNREGPAVDWAELKTRLDREWQDLLTEIDDVENVFGRNDAEE